MDSNTRIRAHGESRPSISLVTTIRNEADNLPDLLESIRRQTLSPQEVIVVDGGSTDHSLDVLETWRPSLALTVLTLPGANISMGRNAGIDCATCDIVAITDAGVRLEPDWLERLVAPLFQDLNHVDVVGGFFEPDARTRFEVALAASTLPDASEIDSASFLPSSRSVAFRRSWFKAGVRYPEWLDYCEDIVFDLRLKRAGARFAFQPKARVHFRPRTSVAEFWRQYYRYARGDGKAGLFGKRHFLRYLTYFVVVPSFFVTRMWWWRTFVIIGAAGYMRGAVMRLWRRNEVGPHALLPLILASAALKGVGDVAKMAGYPAGALWRLRRFGLGKDWRSIPEELSKTIPR